MDERVEYMKDIRDKSITAKSATSKYKRQNTFNNYSENQSNKKDGVVVSYNLNAPMNWKTFKSMPADLQKEYLEKLVKHGVRDNKLAEMFGVTSKTVICARNLFGIKSETKRMTAESMEWWNDFMAVAKESEPETKVVEAEKELVCEIAPAPQKYRSSVNRLSVTMTSFDFDFLKILDTQFRGREIEIDINIREKA